MSDWMKNEKLLENKNRFNSKNEENFVQINNISKISKSRFKFSLAWICIKTVVLFYPIFVYFVDVKHQKISDLYSKNTDENSIIFKPSIFIRITKIRYDSVQKTVIQSTMIKPFNENHYFWIVRFAIGKRCKPLKCIASYKKTKRLSCCMKETTKPLTHHMLKCHWIFHVSKPNGMHTRKEKN